MSETPAADFVHLHVHTQYSLLDGAIRLDDLMEKCLEFGMKAVTITDHGAMFGALEFYTKARKKGLKPIIGCEFYIAPKDRFDRNARSAGEAAFHIVLLAMDRTGYQNLLKLASLAQLEGFYYKPRIDKEILAIHNQGLIALTACLHGEIPHLIAREKNPVAARKVAEELHGIFPGRLYFEIQANGIPEQEVVNQGLMELSSQTGIPLVATNDCHYLNRGESHAHEVLLCIQTSKTIHDANRFRFSTDELYFKSPDEMRAAFAHCPEALANTVEIASRCNLELTFDDHHFPVFAVPEGETLETIFDKEARDGLQARLAEMREMQSLTPELEKMYQDRLELELRVIKAMGFPGYFLIVADFINWAKEHHIPVGPGRGSGAGSLVAYSLRITDIDPIPYGLIFERFLNIERKSLPDFDVDFCQERRGEILQYVQRKYGAGHVAQIVTFGSMKARAVLRDVGRALAMPYADVDRIAKLVPEELNITLKKAIEREPRLRDAAKREPQVEELLTIAQVLEGLPRHTSTHAAGVVISPLPMSNYLPLCRGPKGEILTQYDMKYTEMTGLIKFDLLGLKTLTVIDRAIKLIGKDASRKIDIHKIPLDDAKTYDLLCKGDALGIFQLESAGMRALLTNMQPELFTDLIALVALYRPGPLESGMVDDFVNTKLGRTIAKYPLPQLEPILKETYGVIVYQEQVMKIANVLANYTLGDADMLRRAMGKKIPEVMASEKDKFMAGADQNGIPHDKAEHIFDLMAKFAGYGFNKSHSAAYALIAYQTAYLKAHYPAQFMAALLSCDMNNTDKVVLYINECKDHDLEVLPPDINESDYDFTVINDRIRFGLAAVKNVGDAALESIMEERAKDGPFESLEEFCSRIDSRRVNRRVIESLVKAGTFDSLKTKRSQLFAILDQALEQAQAAQRDKQSGQISLFSIMSAATVTKSQTIPLPDIPEWEDSIKLQFEKETVGYYLTGHPLDNFRDQIKAIADTDAIGLADWTDNHPVRLGGIVRSLKEHKSKKGDAMAFVILEDTTGAFEVVVFPDVYAASAGLLNTDQPLIVQGVLKKEDRGEKVIAKIIADSLDLLPDARIKYTERTHIRLKSDRTDHATLEALKKLMRQHHGPCPVSLTLHFTKRGEVDIDMPNDFTIKPDHAFTCGVEKTLGYAAISYIKKKTETGQRLGGNGSWRR